MTYNELIITPISDFCHCLICNLIPCFGSWFYYHHWARFTYETSSVSNTLKQSSILVYNSWYSLDLSFSSSFRTVIKQKITVLWYSSCVHFNGTSVNTVIHMVGIVLLFYYVMKILGLGVKFIIFGSCNFIIIVPPPQICVWLFLFLTATFYSLTGFSYNQCSVTVWMSCSQSPNIYSLHILTITTHTLTARKGLTQSNGPISCIFFTRLWNWSQILKHSTFNWRQDKSNRLSD